MNFTFKVKYENTFEIEAVSEDEARDKLDGELFGVDSMDMDIELAGVSGEDEEEDDQQ
ncbi:hypothetical protein lbkm_0661 [Lachnospiraceae bacterium KM106-2]|nr:hypothetical protein lbkm_0661 [Lachnospiraceae bacterium KM106-2]